MSAYISKTDYLYQIRRDRLDQILEEADEDEDAILDNAELEAMSMIEKHLATKYDMPLEFSQTGASRHKVILRWAKVLVIYYIYERIPDDMRPASVIKNYDDAIKQLERVENGDAGIPGLTLKTTTDNAGDTVPKTKRRWGSEPKHAHDGGSPGYLK